MAGRFTWFVAGAGAGMAGASYLRRKLHQATRPAARRRGPSDPGTRVKAALAEARAAVAEGTAAARRYRAEAARRALDDPPER
ncbi:hypothetical protein [Candidatus Poriferisocius sp.]|uniref:hypothetical protein n=1 Tax=Candidatus Poriferisocius sp. TaxID=3101276 RepID=UPI003B58EB77